MRHNNYGEVCHRTGHYRCRRGESSTLAIADVREKIATERDITDIDVMSAGRYNIIIEVMSTGTNYN